LTIVMRGSSRPLGLALGPLVALAISLSPTPASMAQYAPAGFPDAPKLVLAIAAWTFAWWISGALPLGITALLPGICASILYASGPRAFGYASAGAAVKAVFSTYMDPTIVLFLGGFILASAIAATGLDKRIAYGLAASRFAGDSIARTSLMVWAACWFLSMWISNTAATMILYPIALSILTATGSKPGSKFGEFLMLGLAYAASAGGLATVIGTPPNLLAVSALEGAKVASIPFANWMLFGIPTSIAALATLFAALWLIYRPGSGGEAVSKEEIEGFKRALGPMGKGERIVLAGFALTVALWILRGLPDALRYTDPALAERLSPIEVLLPNDCIPPLIVGLALFAIPISLRPYRPLLDWESGMKYVEWEVLLIFGGGLVLGDAILKSGLAKWMAASLMGGRMDAALLAAIGVAMGFAITQFTSNTSTAAMLAPLIVGIGRELGMGAGGVAFAVVSSALATSFALMFPVSTPPNAIVYGSGYIRMNRMAIVGLIIGLIWMAALMPLCWILVPRALRAM